MVTIQFYTDLHCMSVFDTVGAMDFEGGIFSDQPVAVLKRISELAIKSVFFL